MNQAAQAASFVTAVKSLNRAFGGTDDEKLDGLFRWVNRDLDPAYIAAKKAREEEKRLAEEKAAAEQFERDKQEAQYLLSPEFREDVIAELIAEGATRLQAEGRTRDSFHLLKEAQRLKLC